MALESFSQICSMPSSPPLMPLSSSSVEYGPMAMPEEMCIFEESDSQDQNSFPGLCFPGAFAPTMHPNLVSTLRNVITRPSELEFLQAGQGFDPPEAEGTQKSRRNSKPEDDHHHHQKHRQIANVSVDLIQNRRPFKCAYGGCDKTFKNRQTLKMHRKTHYSDSNTESEPQLMESSGASWCRAGQNKKIPCRCPVCGRTFVGLYELRRHFGRKHSQGEKMHGCRKCGKRFYIEVDLRDHEKLCGEPIECKCGMKFAFKCNLVAHRKSHPDCQDSASEDYSYPYGRIHSAPAVGSSAFGEDSSSSSSSLALMIPPGVKLEGIGNFPCILPPDLVGHGSVML